MKVWVSKFALTKGIFEIEVKDFKTIGEHNKGKEWHLSKDEAILKAEEMRKKKIDSLYQQIQKLESLNFD